MSRSGQTTNGPLKFWCLGFPGLPRHGAECTDGAVMVRASRRRSDTCRSFFRATGAAWWWWGPRERRKMESGGNLSWTPWRWIAREVPSVLRRSTHLAHRRRWMRMLAVLCGRSFADHRGCGARLARGARNRQRRLQRVLFQSRVGEKKKRCTPAGASWSWV